MSALSDRFAPWGPGRLAPPGGLTDERLRVKIQRYKRAVAKRYRIIPPDKLDTLLPPGALHISTKVDGELWFLVKQGGEVALCAYNGRVITGVPVTDEAAAQLASVDQALIAGELFAALGRSDDRWRVHDVARALNDDAAAPKVGFKAFDLLELDGADAQALAYGERWERLSALLGGGRRSSTVTTVMGERDEAQRRYAQWVQSGKFEGLVVRSEHGLTYKIKPEIHVDAVVIGFGERNDAGLEDVRELHLALVRDDGSFHVIGPVGTGFSDAERVAWRARLEAMVVPSDYRMANREGTLARFVRPEIVVQIRVSDLLATDVADNPSTQMTLSFADGAWSPLQVLPIPSLIHPAFIRERDDKVPDAANVGLSQIWSYLPFAGRETTPTRARLPPSELLVRRVWTKTTKGKVAVRKFVLFATHKAEADDRYPPFVIFSTDYSPSRKDPLQTGVRVASTRERADAQVEAWIASNVKRGWSEVEPEPHAAVEDTEPNP